MRTYVVNRPDPEAMSRVLEQAGPEGIVLRLAWQAGLSREEISALTWDQVSFLDNRLELPDRMIPLEGELRTALWRLWEQNQERSPRVVLSSRGRTPLAPESISRIARQALDREGQTAVRLMDLRHDWILRQLETQDWAQVARISGVEVPALQARFSALVPERKTLPRQSGQVDEFKLWRVLQTERSSPAGLALWLTWQLGLRLEEVVSLRWDQVDGEVLRLEDRTVPLTSGVLGVLTDLRAAEPETTYVLTAPRSGQPYDRTRLSKVVRAALVKAGLDNLTLRDLRLDCDIRVGGENEVTACLRRQQSITRNEAAELLGVSRSTAYNRLKQMVRRGKLTQIGARYYLSAAVVPPERQEAVILDYLSREGFAYRQDIAQLLGIDPSQCRPILQRMVTAGQIVQERQRYLPRAAVIRKNP